jgi:uncharacterized OB-fold protein
VTLEVRPAPRHGVWEAPFWEHVERGQLHLQRCDDCGHVWYPPGPACPACLSVHWRWSPVQGRGRLLSWATFHRQYFETIPPPYTVVAVALDEGPILIADVRVDPATLSMGEEMELTYRLVEDPDGRPFTLYGWQPASNPEPAAVHASEQEHHS